MARIIRVAVKLTFARIRLDESTVWEAGFAEHAPVRSAALVRTNVAAGHSGVDPIGVRPPSGFSLYPIGGLELNGSSCTGQTVGAW